MIKEEFVSFEVAKILKEKGFNEYCWKLYELGDCDIPVLLNGFDLCSESGFWNNEYLELYKKEHSYINDICSAPTLQMAMRWLREVHKVNIEIHYNRFGENYKYLIIYKPEILDDIRSLGVYYSYEEAVEVALKYCLENLI